MPLPDRRSEADLGRQVPPQRVGRIREVGLIALYLASSASDTMTGQTIFLDGGVSL